MLMYAQLAAGISGTILIRVPRVPAVDSLLPPASWCHAGAEKRTIPKEMLLLSHMSTTVAAIDANLLPQGNAPTCPQPRVLNPQRLKHMEIDNGGIIGGFYGE